VSLPASLSLRITGQSSDVTACASRHVIEITRVRITDAGRQPLAG